jgi:hypothetical protein
VHPTPRRDPDRHVKNKGCMLFREEAAEEILGYIRMARLIQGQSTIDENQQHLSAALCHVDEIEALIQRSNSKREWEVDPEPTFRRAISELRKLNGIWAQNPATYLQFWLRPIPIL